MTASLADRLRAIAANPTPAGLAELLPIACEVGRIEASLDEITADALALQHARRDGRRHGHLVVVA